jgi:hypothetical protein
VEGHDVARAERLRVLLARCDAGRFGGVTGENDAALAREAREMLTSIDREMRT